MGTVVYATVNGRVLSQTRSGVRSFYSLDPLGNTRALYDNTQTKTDTFTYTPFGTVATRTGTTTTSFQWNGGSGYYQNSATRVYVRARNYYANLGRWSTQDPIGFKGGDFNLYRYVQNQVVTLNDPSGLCGHTIIGSGNRQNNPDSVYIGELFGKACASINTSQSDPLPGGKGNANCAVICLVEVVKAIDKKKGNKRGLQSQFLAAMNYWFCALNYCKNSVSWSIDTQPEPKSLCSISGYCGWADWNVSPCTIHICPNFLDKPGTQPTPENNYCSNRANHHSLIIHEILHCCFKDSTGEGNQFTNPAHSKLNQAGICISLCKPGS